MIANCMFFDIDLPCFSQKLIRVNNHVAYITIGIKNKIKNFETHTSGGLRKFRKKGKGKRAQPQRSIDLERWRNAVNRKTVRDRGLQ